MNDRDDILHALVFLKHLKLQTFHWLRTGHQTMSHLTPVVSFTNINDKKESALCTRRRETLYNSKNQTTTSARKFTTNDLSDVSFRAKPCALMKQSRNIYRVSCDITRMQGDVRPRSPVTELTVTVYFKAAGLLPRIIKNRVNEKRRRESPKYF